MNEILFHPAFWMPLAMGIVGIAVFVFGNARLKPGIRIGGLGIVLLTLIWVGAAYYVDTFNEKCVKRTDTIIAAVESAKWPELQAMLDANTRLVGLRGGEQIAKTAELYAAPAQISAIRIVNHELQPTPGGVDVSIDCIVEAQQSSLWTWTFSFEQRPDGILLRQITPVRFNGKPMDQIERLLGGR